MKFGETLYRRSVPKWAAYNVNYNEIKHLIKRRTTRGIAEPVPIPGASSHRWRELEDELFLILKAQHDNVSLFLRSKYGEIERRLAHLERQLKGAQRTIEHEHEQYHGTKSLYAKRYRKLLEEAEQIGEDVQALTRFAAVQKTAFRKILKKYRKWTHSIELQTRLENEIFSLGELNLDFTRPLERLAVQTRFITEELQGPMLQTGSAVPAVHRRGSSTGQVSPILQINEACQRGALAFDAALAVTTFGRSAGSATYWIHPDNLDEAVVMLMRHMQELSRSPAASRHGSVASLDASESIGSRPASSTDTHIIFLDNAQRFIQDQAVHRPSKVAVSGRWCQSPEALIALSDLATWGAKSDTIRVKRKDLPKALDRLDFSVQKRKSSSAYAWDVLRIQDYLAEHRDVKPLGQVHSQRHRYAGSSNSTQVGMWATLDTDIIVAPYDSLHVGSTRADTETGEVFPHAVLEIRWEFGHTPEVVRAFDASHLAEKVSGFSLEAAVVYASDEALGPAPWKATLEKDIRKVPVTARASKNRNSIQISTTGISSGTSSTDGPADSVFSLTAGQSSATSDASPEASAREMTPSSHRYGHDHKAKKARFDPRTPEPPPPPPPQQRYWNEFDDGDSDTNPHESYTIYVDPDEGFPGVESVTKLFQAVSTSLSQTSSRVAAWIPFYAHKENGAMANERTHLLITSEPEADSSDSDTTPTSSTSPLRSKKHALFPNPSELAYIRRSPSYRPHQTLTKRQTALETTYLQFYSGLIILAYVLLFMSGVLLGTGRKKARVEVDVAVVCGIVAAEVCAVVSLVLACLRRMPLGIVHWGIVSVATTGIVVIGVGLVIGILNNNHAT